MTVPDAIVWPRAGHGRNQAGFPNRKSATRGSNSVRDAVCDRHHFVVR